MTQRRVDPVPNVPLLDDPVRDSIFKRWLEALLTRLTGAGQILTADLPFGAAYQVLQTNSIAAADEWTSWPMLNQSVAAGEIMTIPAAFSLAIAGPIMNSGEVRNSGTRMIL